MNTVSDAGRIALDYAPVMAQSLWVQDGHYDVRDFLTLVNMMNSWEDVPCNYQAVTIDGYKQAPFRFKPVVYWWAMASKSHTFIGYAFYRPYDWCADFWRIVKSFRESDEHANDMEGVVLMVNHETQKVEALFAVAHWDIIPFLYPLDRDHSKFHRTSDLIKRPERTLRVYDYDKDVGVYVHSAAGSHALDCWSVSGRVCKWMQRSLKGEVVSGMLYSAGYANNHCEYPDAFYLRGMQVVAYRLEHIGDEHSLLLRRGQKPFMLDNSGVEVFASYDPRLQKVVSGKAVPPWMWASCNDRENRGQLFWRPDRLADRYLDGARVNTEMVWSTLGDMNDERLTELL